jgi:hypothetical protein
MTKLNETTKARPSEVLAAAAAIAGGTQAYAEVIIFINPPEGEPGHFDWTLDSDEFNLNVWLDITRPSTDQGGLVGPSSVGQIGSGFPFIITNFTSGGASVATVPGGYYGNYTLTRRFQAGAEIGAADAPFGSTSIHFHRRTSKYGSQTYTAFHQGKLAGYMGVRFSDVDGNHYGWISVVRHFSSFDAFAWGYETEPGVPIVAGVPAPDTLAALAFGAALTGRRRKRKDD